MKRRTFLGLLAGTAVAAPFSAGAQRPRQVGVLVGLAPKMESPVAEAFIRPFRDEMLLRGWAEGNNVRVEYRFGGTLSDLAQTRASAAELVSLRPDVIYSQGLPATIALRQSTSTIPIVFTQLIDPVGFGLARSLAEPGENVTGFIVWDFAIAGKWIQLLQELVPGLVEVGILFNPETAPYAPGLISVAREVGRSLKIVECQTRSDSETETVLRDFAAQRGRALLVIPEPFTNGHRDHIIASCARYKLPAINSVIGAKSHGALISYTFVWDELIRAPVGYIDRILKGAAPRDLPIQAPRRYELVINLKTAKNLGLEVPPGLLARADEVIE